MAASLTRDYAAFCARLRRETLPEDVLAVVRLGFTDCAGVLLAGMDEPVVRLLRDHLAALGGTPRASYFFGEGRATLSQAGFLDATAAHALDFDDYAFSNHPSAVLVPTVLAAAEASGADGATMARGYVAGYEVWADLMLREPSHLHSKGWHPTAVFGPVAAAAAASLVLGHDEARTLHALALAASLAGGVFENFGTMCKPLHGGRAAEAGLTAAGLAGAGIEASPTAIEGERGLLRALSPEGKVDVETRTPLGAPFRIAAMRLNIKKYPTVGASQRSIDSVLAFRREHGAIDPARVTRIVPRVSVKHAAVMPFQRPQTALEAKFSLPFAVSCALLHGQVGLMQLKDDVVRAPALQRLIGLVETETTEEFDPGYPAAAPYDIVRITLDDGRTLETPKVVRATGHADVPLPVAELKAKFDDCAAFGRVDAGQRDALWSAMQRLDALRGTGDIPRIVRSN